LASPPLVVAYALAGKIKTKHKQNKTKKPRKQTKTTIMNKKTHKNNH